MTWLRGFRISERAYAVVVAVFASAVLIGYGGTIWLVLHVRAQDARIARVTKRIERPTAAQVRRGIDQVIAELTRKQRRRLFEALLATASAADRVRAGLSPAAPSGYRLNAPPGSGSPSRAPAGPSPPSSRTRPRPEPPPRSRPMPRPSPPPRHGPPSSPLPQQLPQLCLPQPVGCL